MSKTVAIIGGGPAGIVAAKEALEAGLAPTVFEKAESLGGLWRPVTGGMWHDMRSNISKYTCVFSDYPWRGFVPDFPNARAVAGYLRDYADAFGVTAKARLNTPVSHVVKNGAQWCVTANRKRKDFDHVVIASGVFQTPDIPALSGMALFEGAVLHSAEYKSPLPFRHKRVAVVGSAFSGNEVAAALAGTDATVTQIVRSPVWPMQRTVEGVPVDLMFNTRAARALTASRTPEERLRLRHEFFSAVFGNPGAAHPALEIAPGTPAGVGVSDTYIDLVREGRINIKRGSAAAFDAAHLFVDSGEKIAADAVIFCTGYRVDLPFLNRQTKLAMEYDPADKIVPLILHKETFHPAAPGLAFAGLYRGPYFGVMELQARWAAQVFAGTLPPPSEADMKEGIAETRAIRAQNPRPQFPRADHIGFADDLAGFIGACPDPAFEQSAEVRAALETGPAIPAHYRLQGPGAKRGAALSAIKAANDRVQRKTPCL